MRSLRVRDSLAFMPIGPPKIDLLGGVFALIPVNPTSTLQGVASCIVEEFDCFERRRVRTSFNDVCAVRLTTSRPLILCDGATRTFSITSAST
ncbi:hypothetical protein QCM77_03970 [Bradyrhizobium sp. SSUT18]|nr:hypothetical protein [Bradyrhizobium sp. SSUT18]MDH2399115.1 hypothetical protein [Bradyrhizobium sp. SSUT18]